jgi:hypothetical protein
VVEVLLEHLILQELMAPVAVVAGAMRLAVMVVMVVMES